MPHADQNVASHADALRAPHAIVTQRTGHFRSLAVGFCFERNNPLFSACFSSEARTVALLRESHTFLYASYVSSIDLIRAYVSRARCIVFLCPFSHRMILIWPCMHQSVDCVACFGPRYGSDLISCWYF